MQKESALKLVVVGVAACAAVFGLSAYAPAKDTQLFTAITAEEQEYLRFIARYGRNYGTKEEFGFRLKTFTENKQKIDEFNALNSTSTVGVNQFTDFTAAEFKQKLGSKKAISQVIKAPTFLDASNLADSVDWRNQGAVTGVKDQGQCGSCWSFSTTGSLEGFHKIATGNLVSLSEQQFVDCDTSSYGCSGGFMQLALQYAVSNPIQLESAYPYTAQNGNCHYDKSQGVVQAKQVFHVPTNDNAQLKAAVALGPVSIAIEADQTAFQSYTGGIISEGCGSSTDHGVLAVGYGEGYWIVKNSWGPNWGESGFVRIADQPGVGVCGINTGANYATTH